MKIGIVFFSLIKRFQGRAKAKMKPENFLLISTSRNLVKIIENIVQKKVDFLEWKGEKKVNLSTNSIRNGLQIILDNEFLSFKECIESHERYRNKGVLFRIKPKGTNFSIGSDSPNDRGEIVKIK